MTRKPSKKSKSNPITTTAGAHQHNTRGQRLARNTLPRPAERHASDPIVDAQADIITIITTIIIIIIIIISRNNNNNNDRTKYGND